MDKPFKPFKFQPTVVETLSPKIGDFRFISSLMDPDWTSQLCFIAKINKTHAYVVMTENYINSTTHTDVVISMEDSNLPFPIALRMEVAGWVRLDQVSEHRVGKLLNPMKDRVLSYYNHPEAGPVSGLMEVIEKQHNLMREFRREGRTGVVIAGSDDVRWRHEAAAVRRLHRLVDWTLF